MSDTFHSGNGFGPQIGGQVQGGFGRNTPYWEEAFWEGQTLSSFNEMIRFALNGNFDNVTFRRDWNQSNPSDENITWQCVIRGGGISAIPGNDVSIDANKPPKPKFQLEESLQVSDLLESSHPKVIELPPKVINAIRNAVHKGLPPEFLTNGYQLNGGTLSATVRDKAAELYQEYMSGTRSHEILGQRLTKLHYVSDATAKKIRLDNHKTNTLYTSQAVKRELNVESPYRDDMFESRTERVNFNGVLKDRYFIGWKRFPATRKVVGQNVNEVVETFVYGGWSIYKDGTPIT